MTTFILFLALVSFTALAATVALLADGGRGDAPRSHETDTRFLPPATWVH